MHELYIAEMILREVCAALPSNISPNAVQEIQLQVGKLDAVIPENLVFIFNAAKKIYGLANASLQIEQIDILCHCRLCDKDFVIDMPMFVCPFCGNGMVDVLQGRGIKLCRIIAEDCQGVEDGNTYHP